MIPAIETVIVVSIGTYYLVLYRQLNRRNAWDQRSRHPGSLASFKFVYPIVLVGVMIAAVAAFWGLGPRIATPPAVVLIGVAVAVAGTLMFSRSVVALDAAYAPCFDMRVPAQVVRTGPYRFVRHPIYTANVLVGLGVFLMSLSLVVAVGVAAICGYYVLAARSEERFCRLNVPGYASYSKGTGAVIPRFRRPA